MRPRPTGGTHTRVPRSPEDRLFGAPSFSAPSGSEDYFRDEEALIITGIATLAGGSWIGTRIERARPEREIRSGSVEAFAKALGGLPPFGPNTSEVRTYVEWITNGPDVEVRGFTVADNETDTQLWRQELEHVSLDLRKRGVLDVMPFFQRAAREAVDQALSRRYGTEPIVSRAALHAAVADLVLQPYFSEIAFRARMRRYFSKQ